MIGIIILGFVVTLILVITVYIICLVIDKVTDWIRTTEITSTPLEAPNQREMPNPQVHHEPQQEQDRRRELPGHVSQEVEPAIASAQNDETELRGTVRWKL